MFTSKIKKRIRNKKVEKKKVQFHTELFSLNLLTALKTSFIKTKLL